MKHGPKRIDTLPKHDQNVSNLRTVQRPVRASGEYKLGEHQNPCSSKRNRLNDTLGHFTAAAEGKVPRLGCAPQRAWRLHKLGRSGLLRRWIAASRTIQWHWRFWTQTRHLPKQVGRGFQVCISVCISICSAPDTLRGLLSPDVGIRRGGASDTVTPPGA
eukprot:3149659-Pyramimonas_sp.AAC.1